jgi:Ras family protein
MLIILVTSGKSSLAVQFVDGHFVDSYYPTIENTFSKTIRHKGQDYATEIVDTAGQDEYSILNSKHFIGIHGYMLVYSVSSLPSFEMIQVIREKILNHLVSTPPFDFGNMLRNNSFTQAKLHFSSIN